MVKKFFQQANAVYTPVSWLKYTTYTVFKYDVKWNS